MDDPCLVHAAAMELAEHRSVEAISIKALEGKISVATIGRVSDKSVAERIQESLAKVQGARSPQQCSLLQSEPGCARCKHLLESIRQLGFTVTESGGAVTEARVRCPTAPKFWRWRDFSLPRIAPRQISIPEEESDLNEWKAQAAAAGLCALFGLAGWFTPQASWSVPLFVAAYIAGGWFAAQEAYDKIRVRTLDVHFLMLAVAASSEALKPRSNTTTQNMKSPGVASLKTSSARNRGWRLSSRRCRDWFFSFCLLRSVRPILPPSSC